MLVAVVAGQSLDMFKYGQGKSMLMNKQYGQNELLMKKLGYPMMNMYGQKDLLNMDLPYYLQGDLVDSKILTIDELFTTQLFKEYMTLPLFREYIKYPVFQKFIQSVYFQKFWTMPEFKQYFVQPELFYKFVLPIVHLFKYDTTTSFEHEQIVNKNVFPFVADYETEFTVPSTFNYNKDLSLQDGLFYKNILDKIYSHLYNIDETTTVKKIVDPITGEIKMIPFGGIESIFGDKLVKDILLKKFLINKNIDIDHIFGEKLITDLLIKKNVDTDLLKKIILAKGLDIDTTIFGDKLIKEYLLKKNVDVELLKNLLFKKNFDVELVKKLLLNKMIVGDDMITNTMYPQELKEKMMMTKFNPLVARMMYGYNKNFDNMDVMGKLNLFDILAKKDLINNKFQTIDVVDKMNLFDILSKKHLALTDKVILNKILADKINDMEKFGNYETVFPKMIQDVTKYEHIPLTLDQVKPMMGVRTFDKKMMVPEIIKA